MSLPIDGSQHEEAFVCTFVRPDKRDRYLFLLARPGRRREILGRIYHNLDIEPGRITTILSNLHFPQPVLQMLRDRGAPTTCYVLSPDGTFDATSMDLEATINTLFDTDAAAVVSCVPGKLCYWKSEQDGYLLEVPAQR